MANSHKILLSSSNVMRSIEIEDFHEIIPNMTSNNEPNGIVTASHNIDSAYNAFNNSEVGWVAGVNSNAYIQYDFLTNTVIEEIFLTAGHNGQGNVYGRYGIKDFEVQVSNDNVVFETIYSGTHPNAAGEYQYSISSRKAFRYLRLFFIDSYYTARGQNIIVERVRPTTKLATVKQLSLQSEENFLNYGMNSEYLNYSNLSSEFKEKHYIQDTAIPLGEGKVFKHDLDKDKVLKKIKIK